MTETLMSIYRVSTTAPRAFGLVPGEIYVEATPAGGGSPRIWVGTAPQSGHSGNVFLLGAPANVTPSVITIDPVDNPSIGNTVHITGQVDPGCVIEMCCLTGTNEEYLVQVNDWAPWDAMPSGPGTLETAPNPHTVGDFDVTWWLPAGDNCRIRVRMQDAPDVFADSNLFQVTS